MATWWKAYHNELDKCALHDGVRLHDLDPQGHNPGTARPGSVWPTSCFTWSVKNEHCLQALTLAKTFQFWQVHCHFFLFLPFFNLPQVHCHFIYFFAFLQFATSLLPQRSVDSYFFIQFESLGVLQHTEAYFDRNVHGKFRECLIRQSQHKNFWEMLFCLETQDSLTSLIVSFSVSISEDRTCFASSSSGLGTSLLLKQHTVHLAILFCVLRRDSENFNFNDSLDSLSDCFQVT